MKEFSNLKLDPFQTEAINSVKEDRSVLVSAPTGAGKTIIAEFVIKKCLDEGRNVIYTAPIKALSNQKFREFNGIFPGEVGIITGDVNINPFATLIIMTTEIFRNRILQDPESLKKYQWIIFDEIHYFDNEERGTVWEESLIFLPSHMRFLGLSATIPNLQTFSRWMRKIHPNPIRVIQETERPVPLHFGYFYDGRVYPHLEVVRRRVYHHKPEDKGKRQDIGPLIRYLKRTRRLPCIFFAFSRKGCEILARKASQQSLLKKEESEKVGEEFDALCRQYGVEGDERTIHMREIICRGVAYHHAGIHPMLKEVLEQLFAGKRIQMIFATETFALGINMPARTVVLEELRKNYGSYFSAIKVRDFYQMAGRAGRRGIDIAGYVYSCIDPARLKYRDLEKIIQGQPEEIQSRLNFSYSTILSLYEIYGDEILTVYSLSFQNFMNRQKGKPFQLKQIKKRIQILKRFGYISNHQVTPKGTFAKKIHGFELPISELYGSGILEKLSEEELGILALAAVYEPRPGRRRPKLSKSSLQLRRLVLKKLHPIHHYEDKFNLSELSKDFHFDLSASLLKWMGESDFDRIVQSVPFDEGEIIRYYRMALQLLREILDTEISPELKSRIQITIHMIKRGVIDAEEEMDKLTTINHREEETGEESPES